MHRSLIVARIIPGAEDDVARIFARSDDTTDLPATAGVTHRSLYSLDDVYIHLLETADLGPESVERARTHPEFLRISERLKPFISPYRTTWRGPADAVATCFYRWDTEEGDES
jgi:cyclase